MASPRRTTRSSGTGGAGRGPAARDPGAPPPLSPMRRLGVGVVVGALVVTVLLGMGGTSRPGAEPDPTDVPVAASVAPDATATPRPEVTIDPDAPVPAVAPVILPPAATVLTVRKVTLPITIPSPGEPLKGLELHVYRNGDLAMDPLRVRDLTMNVKDIPLKRGQNRIAMALANAAGEGARSETVVITVDDRAPRIEIAEPDDGSIVNSSLATVRGRTDPGLTVTVRNPGYGATEETVADERGVFIVEIRLDKATNRLEISTVDEAGNAEKQTITVVRGDTEPEARLTLSKNELREKDLPQTINIRLEINDPDGRPLDGVAVTFTLSPPGLGTETYSTVSKDGIARWDGVLIQGASKGNGYVTARADLTGGLAPALATKPLLVK